MKITPQTAERLARGRELFNSGLYFEAHEAWEDAWRVEAGPVRLILHGLIQVAAGLHKATRRNQPGGCVRLLQAGLDKLQDAPEDSCGLAIGGNFGPRSWKRWSGPGVGRRAIRASTDRLSPG